MNAHLGGTADAENWPRKSKNFNRIALAFLRLKRRFDGGGPGWRDFLFVDDMTSLPVVIPLFAVIGLVGLFIARAWPYGSFHNAGLGLFVVSGVIIFLDIKRVFDRMNSQPR